MHYEALTPHQFQALQPYIDTLLVSAHSPFALDIALPHGASKVISEHLAALVNDRFIGRMAHIGAGAALGIGRVCDDWLASMEQAFGYPVQHGVAIVERTLLSPSHRCTSPTGTDWFVVDWWQWLRERVPQHRQADAWMYLVQTTAWRHSEERRRLGLTDDTAADMAQEGRRLLDQMTAWICDTVTEQWRQT